MTRNAVQGSFPTIQQPNGVALSESATNEVDNLVDDPGPGNPTPATKAELRHRDGRGLHHTRISGVWAALFVAVLLGVALIDFVLQNTRSVHIEFFSASGQIPVAVALLAATLTGAAVVLAVGICRTAQLRLVLRRRRKHQVEANAGGNDIGGTIDQ